MSEASATLGAMQADRLVAYSDGVVAIIVTIMVLELHAPSSRDPAALLALWPTFSAYALSFLLVSIYWVNHHHLLHSNRLIGRDVLSLNIHFLFWLSLFPFATAYLSTTRGAPLATALYAGLGLAAAMAFRFLGDGLSRRNADSAVVARVAPDRRRKNTLALMANLAALPAAFVSAPLALALLVVPAVLYFLPDARVEQVGREAG